jgi:DNA-binding transcriptional MocR family regulator
MDKTFLAAQLTDSIVGATRNSSADGIARAVAHLAAREEITAGQRLPTVRELASALGVSPSTVGEAWRTLAAQGILDTQGRRGTFLRRRTGEEPVRHFRHVSGADSRIDLSTGYPDPELLPDLRPFLHGLAEGPSYPGYTEVAVDPELQECLRETLPFPPKAMTLGTDTLATLSELLPVLTRFGDRVVVGDAEFAPYLDLFERFGLECVAVPQDSGGLDVTEVTSAVMSGVALVLLQPRVHNPTGVVMSPGRLEQIAMLCRQNDTWILETDHFGLLASSGPMSASTTAPEQTVYIRSFSKDLHPDLRVCVLTGPNEVIRRVQERRVGGGWLSTINQRLLKAMLASHLPSTVSSTKAIYDHRRSAFLRALGDNGVAVSSRDGFNVWVPVRSEDSALVYLASRGISAAPGAAFRPRPDMPAHIRVSIAQMREGHSALGELVANAAHSRRLGAR